MFLSPLIIPYQFLFLRIIVLRKNGRLSAFAQVLSQASSPLLPALVSWVPVCLFLRKKNSTTHNSLFTLRLAAAVLFGFMAGTVCNFATQLKFFAGYDDSLDVGSFFLLKEFKLTNSGVDLRFPCRRRCRWEFANGAFRTSQRCCFRRVHCHPWRLVGPSLYPACLASRRLCCRPQLFICYDCEYP